jgi:hypothetical protein
MLNKEIIMNILERGNLKHEKQVDKFKLTKQYLAQLTKDNATKEAKILLNKLPKHWKIDVWENLGWHYCAFYKNMSIWATYHKNKPVSYSIMMSDSDKYARSGSHNWFIGNTYYSSDPNKLIRLQLPVCASRTPLPLGMGMNASFLENNIDLF